MDTKVKFIIRFSNVSLQPSVLIVYRLSNLGSRNMKVSIEYCTM